MKKYVSWVCIFLVVVMFGLFAVGSSEDNETTKSATGITSLKFLRDDAVDLNVGAKDWSYFTVKGNDKFLLSDIKFVSDSPEIAIIEYDSTALTTFVYYNIIAKAPGETKVYVQTTDGVIKSEEIIVRVSGSTTIENDEVTTINTDETTREPDTTEVKKVDYILTVDDLINALNKNALKASSTYKGKYVQLTGKVSSVDSSGDYFGLEMLSNDYSLISVVCNINEDQINTVANFTVGQKVTVIGTITMVGEILGYTVDVDVIK